MEPRAEEFAGSRTSAVGRKRALSDTEDLISPASHKKARSAQVSAGSSNQAYLAIHSRSSPRDVKPSLTIPEVSQSIPEVQQSVVPQPAVLWNGRREDSLGDSISHGLGSCSNSMNVLQGITERGDTMSTEVPLPMERRNTGSADGYDGVPCYSHSRTNGVPHGRDTDCDDEFGPCAQEPFDIVEGVAPLRDQPVLLEDRANSQGGTGPDAQAPSEPSLLGSQGTATILPPKSANTNLEQREARPVLPLQLSSVPSYETPAHSVVLAEVLRQGEKISLQDLTFAEFARVYMENNINKARASKFIVTRRAFAVYLDAYYPSSQLAEALKAKAMRIAFGGASGKIIVEARNGALGLPNKKKKKRQKAGETAKQAGGPPATSVLAAEPAPKGVPKQQHSIVPSCVSSKSLSTSPSAKPASRVRHYQELQDSLDYYQLSPDEIRVHNEEVNMLSNLAKGITSQENMIIEQSPDITMDSEEIRLIQEYFPNIQKPELPRCVTCAEDGHKASSCPYSTCATCGAKNTHASSACPNSQRCRRCRQVGHSRKQCTEKLLPTKSEAAGCDLCHARDHFDTQCDFLWRSYIPRAQSIKTVANLVVYCYCCGASGHYGLDCGLRRGQVTSEGQTWSKTNLDRFLHDESKYRALSAGTMQSNNPSANKIKPYGRVTVPGADVESEEGYPLVRPPVNNKPAKKPIYISRPNTFQGLNSNHHPLNRGSDPRWSGPSTGQYYSNVPVPHGGQFNINSGNGDTGPGRKMDKKKKKKQKSKGVAPTRIERAERHRKQNRQGY